MSHKDWKGASSIVGGKVIGIDGGKEGILKQDPGEIHSNELIVLETIHGHCFLQVRLSPAPKFKLGDEIDARSDFTYFMQGALVTFISRDEDIIFYLSVRRNGQKIYSAGEYGIFGLS